MQIWLQIDSFTGHLVADATRIKEKMLEFCSTVLPIHCVSITLRLLNQKNIEGIEIEIWLGLTCIWTIETSWDIHQFITVAPSSYMHKQRQTVIFYACLYLLIYFSKHFSDVGQATFVKVSHTIDWFTGQRRTGMRSASVALLERKERKEV